MTGRWALGTGQRKRGLEALAGGGVESGLQAGKAGNEMEEAGLAIDEFGTPLIEMAPVQFVAWRAFGDQSIENWGWIRSAGAFELR